MESRPTAAGIPVSEEEITFPSVAWFERLAKLMNANRARQEQLGYVDCVAEFTVLDGRETGGSWSVQVAFEEFDATDVREAGESERERADFRVEGCLATWREMIESIAAGQGRPELEHTLNRLTHVGTPMCLASDDPLRRDLFFRYNQSLQEFLNASATFRTTFLG